MRRLRAFIADWDDTISSDTIHLVAKAAYGTKSHNHSWRHFVDLYRRNYDQFIKATPSPSSVDQELRYQQLLRSVELSSVDEYVKVKLFQGVRVSTLEEQANDVQLFTGSIEFLRNLQLNDIPVYILSVNWTSIIMKRVLALNGLDISKVRFITNEFEQVDQVLTGNVSPVRDLRTGSDKLEQFNMIKKDLYSKGIQDGIYYIGDSSSDFFPILEADCGIAFGNGGALSKLQKYNIPYVEGLEGPYNIKHIQSWNELATLLHK